MLAFLPGAACGARAAHVVKLGPIGIACHLKQALPALGEVTKRNGNEKGDQHLRFLVRFAKDGGEGHGEYFVAEIVAGMQCPSAPVFV